MECKDLKLATLSPLTGKNAKTADCKLDLLTSKVVLKGKRLKRMCQGENNILYIEIEGTDRILKLDWCETDNLTEMKKEEIPTGITKPEGLCFVPSAPSMLVISDHYGHSVQAISCDSKKIVWRLSGAVDGKKMYPRGLLFSSDNNSIIVADGERSRVLVLDPASGAHLQTIGPSEDTLPVMCVAFDASSYQEGNPETNNPKWLVVTHRNYPGYLGCARFTENLSELTKTWSSGATECRV